MSDALRPLVAAGMLLGMSFAAFFDGIVLHQILQWHHMICQERTCHPTSIADLQRKDRADGWFHLGAYAVLLLGTAQLFRAARTRGVVLSGAAFVGSLLAGAGLFNLVEGVIDHHLLQIHHVRFGPDRVAWDLNFLAVSALVFGAGVALIRSASAHLPAPADAPAGSSAHPARRIT
jgi:uncharacterized membrane protein